MRCPRSVLRRAVHVLKKISNAGLGWRLPCLRCALPPVMHRAVGAAVGTFLVGWLVVGRVGERGNGGMGQGMWKGGSLSAVFLLFASIKRGSTPLNACGVRGDRAALVS